MPLTLGAKLPIQIRGQAQLDAGLCQNPGWVPGETLCGAQIFCAAIDSVDCHARPAPICTGLARLDTHSSVQVRTHSNMVKKPRAVDTLELIRQSGLFDDVFYLGRYPDLREGVPDLLAHYASYGDKEGRQPNALFDAAWYRAHYLAGDADAGALLHYLREGEAAGNKPSPWFDPAWYARTYEIDPARQNALAHFLSVRDGNAHSPNAFFDVAFYLARYPDIAQANVEAYTHYLDWGALEGRSPSPEFDPAFVWRSYLGNDRTKNPFKLFVEYSAQFGWRSCKPHGEATVSREIKRFSAPGPDFEAEPHVIPTGILPKAKVLAYYLPQYHAIEENDAWWGKGFTEWRNLVRGSPRFAGHYQPRCPRDLGFYALDTLDTLRKQVELAKNSGIFGFAYYYYNFNGRRLLEKPLEALLADSSIDFPFCIIYANENWTRRWDGQEQDVLMRQDYRLEDEVAFIADLARHFSDPRYIRVDGRPLFLIYRADVIPECAKVIDRWRTSLRTDYGLDPLFLMAQVFDSNDPRPFSFDGAFEFPPHKLDSSTPAENHNVMMLDDDMVGKVSSYDTIIERSLNDLDAPFPLIKTAVPHWDNDARKQGSGLVLHGSTPQKFEAWVAKLVENARNNPTFGEAFVFINAWNEWCEGAYLEPDVHYGYAYLNALSRAITVSDNIVPKRMLLVGHDAFTAGAQHLLLKIGECLRYKFGYDIVFILLDGGPLLEKYKTVGKTIVATDMQAVSTKLSELKKSGFDHAITNTTFAATMIGYFKAYNIKTCSLIHELPRILKENGGENYYEIIKKHSDFVVFPNDYVANEVTSEFGLPEGATLIRPQGIYNLPVYAPDAFLNVRKNLGIPEKAKIILNVGYGDLRKGLDLFIETAAAFAKARTDVHFIWVGGVDPRLAIWLKQDVQRRKIANIHFVDFTNDIASYYSAADLFFLTSREDPFPSVILEALFAQLPVLAFDSGGGYVDLIQTNSMLGRTTDYLNVPEAIKSIEAMLSDPVLNGEKAIKYRPSFVEENFDFAQYVFDLTQILQNQQSMSAIIPNYNYKKYIEDRIITVTSQNYPLFEVIVLDDASSDGSPDFIRSLEGRMRRDFTKIFNEKNSGNVFLQWMKGISAAKGDFVWIAEADDLSSPEFVSTLMTAFDDPEVIFAFSNSHRIDENGALDPHTYIEYYQTVFDGALAQDAKIDAAEFLNDYLAIKNVILNVSSVIWRKSTLLQVLQRCAKEITSFRMAGDWRLYVEACLLGGKIAYFAKPLNVHRRHGNSVTHSLDLDRHINEVERIHQLVKTVVPNRSVHMKMSTYLNELGAQFSKT
jgi:glycosyltransferase involved in cell wall biosynthesis